MVSTQECAPVVRRQSTTRQDPSMLPANLLEYLGGSLHRQLGKSTASRVARTTSPTRPTGPVGAAPDRLGEEAGPSDPPVVVTGCELRSGASWRTTGRFRRRAPDWNADAGLRCQRTATAQWSAPTRSNGEQARCVAQQLAGLDRAESRHHGIHRDAGVTQC
jgi:hypothetical protein